MSLAGLLATVAEDPTIRSILAAAPDDPTAGERELVAPQALRPVLAAALSATRGRFVLAVTATAREAEDLPAGLGALLPPQTVANPPGCGRLPHARSSPRADT